MFWKQSEIDKKVNPKLNKGAGTVSKSFSPYKILSTLELPEDFTGKEAVASTLKSLETCYNGATALPGMLSGIGRGMALGDMASYADLQEKFLTTQRSLTETKVGATVFQGTGYKPTAEEIQRILTKGVGGSGDGGNSPTDEEIQKMLANYMPTGEEWHAATEYAQDPFAGYTIGPANDSITSTKSSFWEGVKTAGFGFASGVASFVGDAIGGVATSACVLTGNYEAAYKVSSFFDFGGKVDSWARFYGVNTDSTLYTGAKVAGQIAANVAVTAAVATATGGASLSVSLPVVGSVGVSTLVNAGIYGNQAISKNMRDSINEIGANNATKADYTKAGWGAMIHGATNSVTTVLTDKVGAVEKIFTNGKASTYIKTAANGVLHGAGNLVHQAVDVATGRKDSVDAGEVIRSAATAATATMTLSQIGSASEDIQKTAKQVYNTAKKIVNPNIVKVAAVVVKGVGNAAKNVVEDATGGSHSYTIDLVNRVFR